MIERLGHRSWHYGILIALGAVLYFVNLGGATLWDVDEGRNTTCAMEMMASGNWIVPTFNGSLRVDKPALLYWLQIFSYQAFGINEFAGRLPSALAAMFTVLLCYELARSMFGRTTGLLAGIALAATPMMCGAARFANPDALLNFCTVLTFAIFWFGLSKRPWWWFALLGAAAGLAVLAKGPVGLAIPGAVIVAFLVWQRQWVVLWDRRWVIASSTFTLVALPWYLWVGVETKGEFLVGFLLGHNINRGLSAMENHGGFPGYYLVVLLVGTAPWSIFLGLAWWFGFWSSIRAPWQRFQSSWDRAAEKSPRVDESDLKDPAAAYRLLLCWTAIYLVFFSVAATKLPNYALPVVAPSAILIGRFLERWRSQALSLPSWIPTAGAATLFTIGLAIGFGLLVASGTWNWSVLRGRSFPELLPWAFVGLIPISAGAAGWWCLRQERKSAFVSVLAITAVLMLAPIAAFGSSVFNEYKASRALVEQAEALRLDEDMRIGCWQVGHLPSLNFYVQRQVVHLPDDNAACEFLKTRLRAYLILPKHEWERLQPVLPGSSRVVARHFDFYSHSELVVVVNR
jgi:4-amino-4-deoxy-L-arabinose transferase-like glycosyltransferase